MEKPVLVTKGGVGYGVDETQKVLDLQLTVLGGCGLGGGGVKTGDFFQRFMFV